MPFLAPILEIILYVKNLIIKYNKIPNTSANQSHNEKVRSGEKYCKTSIPRPYNINGKAFHNQNGLRDTAKSIKNANPIKTITCLNLSENAKPSGTSKLRVATQAPKTIKNTTNNLALTLKASTPFK